MHINGQNNELKQTIHRYRGVVMNAMKFAIKD